MECQRHGLWRKKNSYPLDNITQETMNTINEDDKFYWICDADDCYFVREHGVGQHIAKCTTKERAEQITKALSEIERLRRENEELRADDLSSSEWLRTLNELAALKKQVVS